MEKVADGVWLLRGDTRKSMNIYFLEDGDGVVQFDAGTKAMVKKARAAAEQLGGLKRIVLGHAHADHRGTAPSLDAPVYCHPDEVAHAEAEGALWAYLDLSRLPAPARWIYPTLLRRWDDGAVKIDGTVAEGDDVAGFRVIHFPGHAPGQIGLWRESDRLAIVSDVVYLIDSTRLGKPLPKGEASVPHPAWGWDHGKAKESVRKLAALAPAVVCTGHDEPLRGENLRETLERAAEKY
jgi:glyoxylase-like metal-dependent hydrolase (beta-lactamase superfamily II)